MPLDPQIVSVEPESGIPTFRDVGARIRSASRTAGTLTSSDRSCLLALLSYDLLDR